MNTSRKAMEWLFCFSIVNLMFGCLSSYVSNKDALSIRKRLLRSAINKRNRELQYLSKELTLSVNVLST